MPLPRRERRGDRTTDRRLKRVLQRKDGDSYTTPRARYRKTRVMRVLDRLVAAVDLPQTIVVDNWPEIAGCTLDAWASARGVALRLIRTETRIENAYVQTVSGKCRDECLNEHCFVNLADAKTATEAWRVVYNTVRPTVRSADVHRTSLPRSRGGSHRLAGLACMKDLKPRGPRTIDGADVRGRSRLPRILTLAPLIQHEEESSSCYARAR